MKMAAFGRDFETFKEQRNEEEWEEMRQEQAKQRAARAEEFHQRRNKWAAQHRTLPQG